jgi:hypothetical protein
MLELIKRMIMKITKTLLLVTGISLSASAHAGTALSSFFQDWKLDASQNNSATCGILLSGYAGLTTPGAFGQPSAPDATNSIRFVTDDGVSPTAYTVGTTADLNDDGFTTVTLSDDLLTISVPVENKDDDTSFNRHQRYTQTSYQLTANGGVMVNDANGTCTYASARPEKIGMKETGATLFNHGVKIAECTFVPATPTPGQVNYFYNEKCSFGKFTIKQVINQEVEVISSELVANPKAVNDTQIIRSSDLLNTESENYFSRDTEIAVVDSNVDEVYPSNSEYFISPYRSSSYAIDGTKAHIELVYSALNASH